MPLEVIGFALTVAAFAKALPEILKCAHDIRDSEKNVHELRMQRREFDRYVSEVEPELRTLLETRPRPVPRKLLRASLALVRHCKARIVKAETFYKKFRADPLTFRFIIYMARAFGKDKIGLLQRRLEEGQDWLRIALNTVGLYYHRHFQPVRANTCITPGCGCRHQAGELRYHLEKAQRYRHTFPKRMEHMNKAGVDFRCIESHARAITEDPMFDGPTPSSSSTASPTSRSENELTNFGTQSRHPSPRLMYQNAHIPRQGLGVGLYSESPAGHGAPLASWVNAQNEPVFVDDRTNHRPRAHHVQWSVAPDRASSTASYSRYSILQGAREPLHRQEVPVQHQRTSSPPRRPSYTSQSSRISLKIDRSEGSGHQRAREPQTHSHRTGTHQSASAHSPPRIHQYTSAQESTHDAALMRGTSPSSRYNPSIRVDTRPSSHSRSSSHAGSSYSSTFSTARDRRLSRDSSPATSFSIPSAGSTRDSGYSTGGSVSGEDVDREQQYGQPRDSRYPPNSYDTRRSGHDSLREKRRSRREKNRRGVSVETYGSLQV